jgi:glutamate-1-semialdehyde 2,1-aminomutase
MPLISDAGSLAALMLAGLLMVMVGVKLRARLALSRAKHRSLAGHSRLSRRIAALVPRYAFDDADFFRADGATAEVADRRRAFCGRRARGRSIRRPTPRPTSPTCSSPRATVCLSRSAPP